MAEELDRRNFLKTAALAAGPAIISARGANDKVNIGWIGVGTRGYASLDWMHTAEPNNVQITAICDTYQGYIARGVDRPALAVRMSFSGEGRKIGHTFHRIMMKSAAKLSYQQAQAAIDG